MDSKPNTSAFVAMNAGSRVYAGSGTTMPTDIAFLRVGEGFSARGGHTVAQRRAPLNHRGASTRVARVQAYRHEAHGPRCLPNAAAERGVVSTRRDPP